MNTSIVSLHEKIIGEFMSLAEKMAAEGCSQQDIMKAFRNYISLKTRKTHKKPPMQKASSVIGDIAKSRRDADSNTERILHDMMVESGIRFKFQYRIGPYRVDYLIGSTIIELDGPHHNARKLQDQVRDKYLRKRGYEIIRIPTYIFNVAPDAVLAEIKGMEGKTPF
ncbi:MAG TPA: DUF559 domain-containing protein [Deltaproteobacteria bacterium]|nr:DUF559 domain-containing protein [Deltaproteobacteria bacterium]HNS82725.1 DUF559 domain-containing protein [Methanolinea sp.]